MIDNQKTALFEQMPVPKAVMKLAVPTILSSLVMVIYNLADTYFVGMMNNPVQNAAVTLAAPVLLAFNAVNNLFGVGSSSMMSRAMGCKDFDTVKKSSAFGFYGALFFGFLFAIACTVFRPALLTLLGADSVTAATTTSYLDWTVTLGAVPAILNVVMAYMIRSEGSSLNASIGTMGGCVVNMILDPICILPWGLDMGAAGAGMATCFANCGALIYFFGYMIVKRGKTSVCISPRAFSLEKRIVLGVCAVGIPASIQNLLNVVGSTVLNNLAASYGAAALAAMGICTKINMVPMYVAMGLSQGVMPLISYNFASRDYKRMKSALLYTIRCSEVLLLASSFLMFFCSGALTGLFIKDPDTVAYGSAFLRGFCLAQPVLALDFMCVGTFQAVGMGRESFVFAILRKIVFEIPLLLLLNAIFPLYGLPFAQAIAELMMALIAIPVMIRFFRRCRAQEELPLQA